jgi:hypothetical protein
MFNHTPHIHRTYTDSPSNVSLPRTLIRRYAKAAPYPHGHALAQNIFQSGLIPGDTDFQVYRDYGGVPGVDMVFISNGHVYHTALDTPERIDRGSVQRAGENVLAVTQALVKSPFMVDAKWTRLQVRKKKTG